MLAAVGANLARPRHGGSTDACLSVVAGVPATEDLEIPSMHRAVAALSACLSSVVFAGENLVMGGDFENVPVGGAGDDCHSSHLSSIPGWSKKVGAYIDRHRNDPTCEDSPEQVLPTGGNYFISLQGSICCGCDNNGWIQQTVPTRAGITYRLEFDVFLDSFDVLQVTVGNESMTLTGERQQGWRGMSLSFDPDGPVLLRFESLSGIGPYADCMEGSGCILDNIAVRPSDGCPADVIENGVVDGADLSAVLAVWGTDGGLYPRADTNGDGVVDGQDLATVLGGWGPCGG